MWREVERIKEYRSTADVVFGDENISNISSMRNGGRIQKKHHG